MKLINFESLNERLHDIRDDFQSKKPFKYVVFENFFYPDAAELIYENYPTIDEGAWKGTTYVNSNKKFEKRKFDSGSVLEQVFIEFNGKEFLKWLEAVTLIDDLVEDDELFGGGLHQSIQGAFLNVHVDFNIHPVTRLHRRLNAIVYMNKDWKEEYEGNLELWDLTGDEKKRLEKVAPLFNRCVIFETNEISFHGHPKPLKAPVGINRKSLATYYYSKERPENEIAPEHNTIYVNTEGIDGEFKKFKSGVKAFLERINKKQS